MSSEKFDRYQKEVIGDEKWINAILIFGLLVSALAIVSKSLGINEFVIQDITISTKYTWLIILALTIAHMYTTWLLTRAIFALWEKDDEEKCKETYYDIKATSNNPILRGTEPV